MRRVWFHSKPFPQDLPLLIRIVYAFNSTAIQFVLLTQRSQPPPAHRLRGLLSLATHGHGHGQADQVVAHLQSDLPKVHVTLFQNVDRLLHEVAVLLRVSELREAGHQQGVDALARFHHTRSVIPSFPLSLSRISGWIPSGPYMIGAAPSFAIERCVAASCEALAPDSGRC